MPIFFFDLCARGRMEANESGIELPSSETAYFQACAAIPPLVSESLRSGDHPRGYSFLVTDEVGRILFDIPFYEVLDSKGRTLRPGPDP